MKDFILAMILVTACAVFPIQAFAKLPPRLQSERVKFIKTHPCPATGMRKFPCKGFIVDHIKARACGGADRAWNMQWQTVAEAKAKDKWERKGCKNGGLA